MKSVTGTTGLHTTASRMNLVVLCIVFIFVFISVAEASFAESSSSSSQTPQKQKHWQEDTASSHDDDGDDDPKTTEEDPSAIHHHKPSRGKILSENFDKNDLLRAYREIQAEYHERAFSDSIDHQHQTQKKQKQKQNLSWRLLRTIKPKDIGPSRSKDPKDPSSEKYDSTISVSMMEHPSDPLCPYVKMETILPVPVQDCWNFLLVDRWDETMPKMDPFYEGVDVHDEYVCSDDGKDDGSVGVEFGDDQKQQQQQQQHPDSNTKASTLKTAMKKNFKLSRRGPSSLWGRGKKTIKSPLIRSNASAVSADKNNNFVHMILARKRTKRILTFAPRDFVFLSVKDKPLEDGTWVSGTVSVDVENIFPRTPRYVRAFQDSVAFYKPMNDDGDTTTGSTKLTIVCRIDLNDSSDVGTGGWIPMWLYVKTIGSTGCKSVLNMRNALLQEKKDKTD